MNELDEFYKLLGLRPGALWPEIKAAYRELCQEYHPDKIPRETPVKARQLLEEHFKQINKAYERLREAVSDQAPSVEPPPQPSTSPQGARANRDSRPRPIFDPERMQTVRERLEREYNQIEESYQTQLEQIATKTKERLAKVGLEEAHMDGYTLNGKLGTIVAAITLAIPGWIGISVLKFSTVWNSVLLILAWLWVIVLVLAILGVIFSKTLSKYQLAKVKPIKEDEEKEKAKAKQVCEKQRDRFKEKVRNHINHFKVMSPELLTENYISELSDENQFYLLKAMEELKDLANFQKNFKVGIKVALGVGLLTAVSLFTGIPFL